MQNLAQDIKDIGVIFGLGPNATIWDQSSEPKHTSLWSFFEDLFSQLQGKASKVTEISSAVESNLIDYTNSVASAVSTGNTLLLGSTTSSLQDILTVLVANQKEELKILEELRQRSKHANARIAEIETDIGEYIHSAGLQFE